MIHPLSIYIFLTSSFFPSVVIPLPWHWGWALHLGLIGYGPRLSLELAWAVRDTTTHEFRCFISRNNVTSHFDAHSHAYTHIHMHTCMLTQRQSHARWTTTRFHSLPKTWASWMYIQLIIGHRKILLGINPLPCSLPFPLPFPPAICSLITSPVSHLLQTTNKTILFLPYHYLFLQTTINTITFFRTTIKTILFLPYLYLFLHTIIQTVLLYLQMHLRTTQNTVLL